MPRAIYVLVASAAVIVAACSSDSSGPGDGPPAGLAACGSGPLLDQTPVPISSISEIGPLGTMSGGGHLFPATALGIHQVAAIAAPAPMVAPGDMVITQVRRTIFEVGASTTYDFAIFFFPCTQVQMHFGHVTTLDASIETRLGTWGASDCAPPYVVAGMTVTQCTKDLELSVASGAPLGTQVGTFDWGATDTRYPLAFVNPARMGGTASPYGDNNAVCPVDYLVPAVRDSLHDSFGEAGVVRTIEPVCGTVMQDVAGTAQGRWFINDIWDERMQLALVRDYVDPTIGAFSVGDSIPSLPTNLYRFDPVGAGRVNLDFPDVTPDGLIYCYEPTPQWGSDYLVFIQLLSATQLRIEGALGSSCGDPATWSFSAGAVTFAR